MCAHTHTHIHPQLLFSPLLAKPRLSRMRMQYGLMARSISKAAPQRCPSVIARPSEHHRLRGSTVLCGTVDPQRGRFPGGPHLIT